MKHLKFTPFAILIVVLLFAVPAPAELISGVTATATSEFVTRVADNTVNGSGLVGDTHALSGSENFWGTVGIGLGAEDDGASAITFDLNGLYLLDQVRVWNGYDPNSDNILRADFQVSLDGVNFTSIGERTFDLPTNPAQNFDLGSIQASHVRFDVLENAEGVQFPYNDADQVRGVVALGEVQFYGSEVPEPSSLILFGCGIFCFFGFNLLRRRGGLLQSRGQAST